MMKKTRFASERLYKVRLDSDHQRSVKQSQGDDFSSGSPRSVPERGFGTLITTYSH